MISINSFLKARIVKVLASCTTSGSQLPTKKTLWLHQCTAFLCGLLGTLSFAPFSFWPAFFVTISAAVWLLNQSSSAKQAFRYGFSLGLGLFGAGISWVFVSISQYGEIGYILSFLVTLLFVSFIALFYGLTLTIAWWLKIKCQNWPTALILAVSFLVTEYLRSYLFTGFPWLLTGYSLHHTWLFELSPIGGIWLLSFLAVLIFAAPLSFLSAYIQQQNMKHHVMVLFIVSMSLVTSIYLAAFPPQWVEKTGEIKATLVQGNMSQDQKWLPSNAEISLDHYINASLDHMGSDIIVWPETAITYLYQDVKSYLSGFSDFLAENQTTLISGVPLLKDESFYNAVWATGQNSGLYLKQHLVPFGEYIPFEKWVGKVLDIFGIPLESFHAGSADQAPLKIGSFNLSTFICYEIAYPDLVRKMTPITDVILTVSNDAWFGNSVAPWQHLEMAQFRAKENGRYVIRGTNTGVSAIIDDNGKIIQQLPQFTRSSMTSKVGLMQGITPYVKYGNYGIMGLLLLIMFSQFLISPNRRVKPLTKINKA